MTYRFVEEEFKNNFSWKSTDVTSADSLRIAHTQDQRFKLFPYKANGKSPIVTDTKEVVGDFIKTALKAESKDTDFSKLIKKVEDEVAIEQENMNSLFSIIRMMFYNEGKFISDNIGMYAYKGSSDNKSVERLAKFLNDVLKVDQDIVHAITEAQKKYPYNALEELVIQCLDAVPSKDNQTEPGYYVVFEDAGKQFKKDFIFMLNSGMTGSDDFADLLALYYLYYTSQTCIVLDHFGSGNRDERTPLYFALDWEKVSANRECCKGGWKILQENVKHIFSHAVTLELLNQTDDPDEMLDYIRFSELVENGTFDDLETAAEIRKIEKIYTDAVGDYKNFYQIPAMNGKNETDVAIRRLFSCVHTQFINKRKSANDKYVNKLIEFYRSRWLKNRKKSGLVFNLTERDIIFLTKLSIQNEERIRLIDLFKEYEKRGVYLDNSSKILLQEFFTKLNMLDKKSDSGDAQYVKRIL